MIWGSEKELDIAIIGKDKVRKSIHSLHFPCSGVVDAL